MIIHYHIHQFYCNHCEFVGDQQKIDDLATLDEMKHMQEHHQSELDKPVKRY